MLLNKVKKIYAMLNEIIQVQDLIQFTSNLSTKDK